MKLKPLAEILAMSKEKLDASLAPIRARQVKAKAETQVALLDEKAITLERDVAELCARKEIDFDKVITAMDEHDLNERRVKQLRAIVADLFPESKS
jgi:hypothetical protein